MRRLCSALGHPQHRFASLHVVGTNGKSSVTLMTAALLEAAGVRTGACVSPHISRWSERIRIGGDEIGAEPFAAAIARVAETIGAVERTLDDGERITQFEAAIAASFVALAAAGVEVGVIEAGLGGRLDATNVIGSRATALTSVGLDHIEWLGSTEAEIAAEKLDVLRDHSALVLGRVGPEVHELAVRTAAERHAELIEPPPADPEALPGGFAPYARRNAALAFALAGLIAEPVAPAAARATLERLPLPGRAELIDGDPPLIIDAAHNEQGALALAEALPGLAAGRPIVACVSILAEKDSEAIVAALAPQLSAVVCTGADPGPAMGRPGAHAGDPAALAALFRAVGIEAEVVAEPAAAVERAIALARARDGVALCAGSHYLLRYAWTARHAPNSSR